MPRPPRINHVRPKEPAAGTHRGEDFLINPSDIYDADHPLVRAYPDLFRPLEATVSKPATAPDVQQATAAPGELRGDN